MKKIILLVVLALLVQHFKTTAQSRKNRKNNLEISVIEKENVKTIYWTTRLEHNSSCFLVEKAVGNSPFEILAIVKANGESKVTTKYKFIDTDTSRVRARYKISLVSVGGDIEAEVDHLHIP